MSIIKQDENAFDVHQSILVLKEQMGVRFLMLGKLLKEIRDKKHFIVLGYDNFISYIINSELGFKKSTAYGYIEIYDWFIERLGYDLQRIGKMSFNKMSRVLSILKNEFNKSEKYPFKLLKSRSETLIEEVQVLRPIDFDKKYKDEKKQEGFEDHLAPPEYFRCECHKKWRLIIPADDCCPQFLEEFYQILKKRFEKSLTIKKD